MLTEVTRLTIPILALLLGAPARAEEAPRVAVSDFTGPYAGQVRVGVVKAIEDKVQVVGYKEARVVVDGDVSQAGKRAWSLRVVLRTATGAGATEKRYRLRKPEVDTRLATVIARDVAEAVAELPAAAPADAPAVSSAAKPDEPSLGAIIAKGADEIPGAPPPPPATVEKKAADAPPHVPRGGPEDPYRPYAVALGFALEQRSLSLSGPPVAGQDVLPAYDSAYYPVIGVRGEVMPAELLDGSEQARNVGLRLAYARALPTETKIAATGASADTTSSRLAVGPFYRIARGDRARPTVLRPGVAWGRRGFDLGGDGPLPSTSYNYVEASLDVEKPLFWRFDATGGLAVHVGTGVSGMDRFAREASINGVDLAVGVRLRLPWSLVFSTGLVYTYFALSMEGSPAILGPTAREGSDAFFGTQFAVAYEP